MVHYGGMGCGQSCGQLESELWRMMKIMTVCVRSAVMLDGEVSKYVDTLVIYKELQRDVRYHETYARHMPNTV